MYNDTLKLSKKNYDRIKFKHLYIEKTLNKKNNNIVLLGDVLNYKLTIINYSKEDYIYDLIIQENIPEFVEFKSHNENKIDVSFNYDRKNKALVWNIGKLKKGEEITINYLLKIVDGKPGDKIESIGFAGNIQSSTIINTIGINLSEKQKNSIKKKFEKLKKKYRKEVN